MCWSKECKYVNRTMSVFFINFYDTRVRKTKGDKRKQRLAQFGTAHTHLSNKKEEQTRHMRTQIVNVQSLKNHRVIEGLRSIKNRTSVLF